MHEDLWSWHACKQTMNTQHGQCCPEVLMMLMLVIVIMMFFYAGHSSKQFMNSVFLTRITS